MKKPSIKTLRNKTDSLLTPWMKKKHKKCLLCSAPVQVAHHHVHKSQSSRLRYEEDNLVWLCGKCHCALHNNESYYASKIVATRGLEWFARLEKMKREIVKTDRSFYEENYNRIKNEL
jgi:5-methylcytosine-specific restriction endonuclease McrA